MAVASTGRSRSRAILTCSRMVFPERVATDATIPDVSLPEVVGQEAWTIDLDAVRAHLHSESQHLGFFLSGFALPRTTKRCTGGK